VTGKKRCVALGKKETAKRKRESARLKDGSDALDWADLIGKGKKAAQRSIVRP